MLRDEYFRRLVDGSYIELYLSASGGAGGRIYWPWKMNPPKESMPRMRNSCERYIIDSDPLDDSVTTTDVLDEAERLDAEIASLQDVYQDKDGTVDSLLEGLEIADDHEFDGQLLLPLQQPFTQCYREIGEPNTHMIGLGGLKDASSTKRLKELRSFRSNVGSDVWIHGFGWGVHGLEDAIRDNPNLIDSVDYSTPVSDSMSGDGYTSGDEMSSVIAMRAATKLITDLREVSEYPDCEPMTQLTL